jgi:hypothetical protein
MSKGLGFSMADLQGAKKRLDEADTPAEAKGPAAPDPEIVAQEEAMEALYNKHDGDLVRIFDELGANPEKALKPHNKPKSAREFARKYVAGFYSLLKDEEPAESKDGHK